MRRRVPSSALPKPPDYPVSSTHADPGWPTTLEDVITSAKVWSLLTMADSPSMARMVGARIGVGQEDPVYGHKQYQVYPVALDSLNTIDARIETVLRCALGQVHYTKKHEYQGYSLVETLRFWRGECLAIPAHAQLETEGQDQEPSDAVVSTVCFLKKAPTGISLGCKEFYQVQTLDQHTYFDGYDLVTRTVSADWLDHIAPGWGARHAVGAGLGLHEDDNAAYSLLIGKYAVQSSQVLAVPSTFGC